MNMDLYIGGPKGDELERIASSMEQIVGVLAEISERLEKVEDRLDDVIMRM